MQKQLFGSGKDPIRAPGVRVENGRAGVVKTDEIKPAIGSGTQGGVTLFERLKGFFEIRGLQIGEVRAHQDNL